MFTIKETSRITGVPEATLRTWERRYGVVDPARTPSGYRLYSPHAIASLSAMRKLVDAGWTPAAAARAILDGKVPVRTAPRGPVDDADDGATPDTYRDRFLAAAARIDPAGIDAALDRGFALGSFEHVVDSWLCPTLVDLGEAWAGGDVDVAGEHAASQAVARRLAAAFEAAGARTRGPSVVVGLPSGSRHELGALAFATAAKRRGLNVLYLGADVPPPSWLEAVRDADAAVLGVVTAADRPNATATARALLEDCPGLPVATGGANGAHVSPGTTDLPTGIGAAAEHLELLLHSADTRGLLAAGVTPPRGS